MNLVTVGRNCMGEIHKYEVMHTKLKTFKFESWSFGLQKWIYSIDALWSLPVIIMHFSVKHTHAHTYTHTHTHFRRRRTKQGWDNWNHFEVRVKKVMDVSAMQH